MSPTEILALVDGMRERGVSTFTHDGLHVTFHEAAVVRELNRAVRERREYRAAESGVASHATLPKGVGDLTTEQMEALGL